MRVKGASRAWMIADAPWRVELELARWMRKHLRVTGFVRCFPHAGGYTTWTEPLGAEELGELTDDGFGVGGYQIFRASRQMDGEDGAAAGEAMAEHATQIGLPDGVTLFTDAEAFREGAETRDYIDRWQKRVAYVTDSRGVYNGSNFLLPQMPANTDPGVQGERLYKLKGITRYWMAMSKVYTASTRGPCLSQMWEYALLGDGPPKCDPPDGYVPWYIEPYDGDNPAHKGRRRFDLNSPRIDSKGGRLMLAVK